MAFDDNLSKVRTGYTDQNPSVVRRLVLDLREQARSVRFGVKSYRNEAGRDYAFPLRVLSIQGRDRPAAIDSYLCLDTRICHTQFL